MTLPQRKNPRLTGYNYADSGTYFITICSHNRSCLFWETTDCLTAPNEIQLSSVGLFTQEAILKIMEVYPEVSLDTYCIMHDHIHLLLTIPQETIPSVSIPKIISQLKSAVSKRTGHSIWQRNYYDHIIRDEEDYKQKYEYITNNPLNFIIRNEW